ncbi:hypothetical protein KEK_22454 [Mycolicibacterium thermoresistibile ATCC 19527]|uniref:Integral membrane protein n=2 Tax=Mycolicibacterium thermoresistibile TaxID=1797 RepID=G7CN93_MYCT3|nr:hypothetical protein KEK_22454 [Mycolicibacterium thermoresistibile ATCC 19527]GAT15366.1 putative uncharacterized protein [Mycolicibacterium thermoresistibile]
MRQAAVIVILEGLAAAVMTVIYIVSGFRDAEVDGLNRFGTAAWFAIMGGGVLAAGWALWTGRRWGRGIAVFANLLLLPVAWYLAVGSGQWSYGIPVALIAGFALVLLFSPSTVQWWSQDSASADNAGPDSR